MAQQIFRRPCRTENIEKVKCQRVKPAGDRRRTAHAFFQVKIRRRRQLHWGNDEGLINKTLPSKIGHRCFQSAQGGQNEMELECRIDFGHCGQNNLN